MGIRKFLTLVTAMLIAPLTHADQVDQIMANCIKQGGKVMQETVSSSSTENCYNILCYQATEGIKNVNFESIEDFLSKTTSQRGAAQIAFDKNKCKEIDGHSAIDIYENDNGRNGNGRVVIDGNSNGDSSNNGNGKVTITRNGEGRSRQDQRVNTGGNGNGSVVIRTDGGNSNGGSVVRGGGRVAFDVDGIQYHTLDHSFVDKCLKKTWFSFLRKNKYKLRKECRSEFGDYIISGSDIDTHIGRDIDGQGRGDSGGNVIIRGRGNGGGTAITRGRGNSGGGRGNGGGGRGTVVLDGGGRDRGSIDGGYYTVNSNGKTYRCAIGQSERECIGSDTYSNVYSRHSDPRDCVHCIQGRSRQSSGAAGILNATANLAGALVPSVFEYLGQRSWSKAYQNVGVANANAIASGYEQCQLMQTNYVQNTYSYIQNNELPDRSVVPPECNGYNLGQFSGGLGYGGSFGSFGSPFSSAGYSTGFLGGMQGPYGQGYLPSVNVTGGFGNPQLGLYGNLGSTGYNPYGGFGNTGLNGGISLGGGFGGSTGYNPYGGFGNTGLNGGISLGGGFGGSTGYNPYGGIALGGGTGYNPYGGINAGANGLVGWPNNNNGSYWSNTNPSFNGSWSGPYAQGQNSSYYNAQTSHAQNYQAASIGNQYQTLALQNQYQRAGQNLNQHYQSSMYNGGSQYYGSVPYSPANMGLSLSGGFNFGI